MEIGKRKDKRIKYQEHKKFVISQINFIAPHD